jgi:hypothetical protein
VYSDSGNGYPGTLLATSVSTTVTTGWMTISPTVSNVALPSSAIWIVHAFSSAR